MPTETAVAASWRDEDATRRRCEVTLYSTNVGEPGSGPEPFKSLMEKVEPEGWRWIAVEFIEANERHLRQRALTGDAPDVTRELDDALGRMAAEIQQARELLRDGDITEADDVPSLYSIGRAWVAAERANHALVDLFENDEDDDDDD
jgi:hypothetical protein